MKMGSLTLIEETPWWWGGGAVHPVPILPKYTLRLRTPASPDVKYCGTVSHCVAYLS